MLWRGLYIVHSSGYHEFGMSHPILQPVLGKPCLSFRDPASGNRDVRIGLPPINFAQCDGTPEHPIRREEDELLASSDRAGPVQLDRYLLTLVVSQNRGRR